MGLSVKNLSKDYGSRKVLRDISFELPYGAHLAIWGPNGSGKTTLLRVLATLEKPTSGSIAFDDLDSVKNADELRDRIGMLGHRTMLYADLSALENLVFYGRLYGIPHAEKRAEELLRQVGLYTRRLDAVKTFSQGMQQRVALARALMHEPSLLLLDEPYSGLDTASADILSRFLQEEPGETTCVMVSHDVQVAADFCTHLLLFGDMTRRTGNTQFLDVRDMPRKEILSLLTGDNDAR